MRGAGAAGPACRRRIAARRPCDSPATAPASEGAAAPRAKRTTTTTRVNFTRSIVAGTWRPRKNALKRILWQLSHLELRPIRGGGGLHAIHDSAMKLVVAGRRERSLASRMRHRGAVAQRWTDRDRSAESQRPGGSGYSLAIGADRHPGSETATRSPCGRTHSCATDVAYLDRRAATPRNNR